MYVSGFCEFLCFYMFYYIKYYVVERVDCCIFCTPRELSIYYNAANILKFYSTNKCLNLLKKRMNFFKNRLYIQSDYVSNIHYVWCVRHFICTHKLHNAPNILQSAWKLAFKTCCWYWMNTLQDLRLIYMYLK